MRLKYILSPQVRIRFRLKLQYFQTMMVSFCLLENGACRAGHTPNGWCNVKVGNLLSLELLKESLVDDEPDLSLVHNYSICMDGTVAKSLFNTTCLQTPIIPLEHSMLISKPFILSTIIICLVALILIVVIALLALYVVRAQKRGKIHQRRHNTSEQPITQRDGNISLHYSKRFIPPLFRL